MPLGHEDLTNRFSFHPATTPRKQGQHEHVRRMCLDLSLDLDSLLPDGREKALAITHLEEVMMWSNAALARFSDDNDEGQTPHRLPSP